MKMKKERIVFLGTPKIAATILQGLIDANYNVVAVISQPDKEIGRKKILTPTPVKEVALKNNLPIYQPISLRKDFEFLKELKPDLLITTAYGQILPQEVLNLASINNINVHGSLLPLYRGGAPIQRAIINGDAKTGVSIMQMIDKMDAGMVYATREILIDKDMNSSMLFEKMAIVGKELLLEVLPAIIDKSLKGIPQDETKVTYAWNIKKEEEKLDLNDNCKNVHNKVNGLADNPGAYVFLNDKKLKIYKTDYSSFNDSLPIGSLKIENKNHLYVKCNDGYLELKEIQLEGKSRLQAKDFLNGINKEILIHQELK